MNAPTCYPSVPKGGALPESKQPILEHWSANIPVRPPGSRSRAGGPEWPRSEALGEGGAAPTGAHLARQGVGQDSTSPAPLSRLLSFRRYPAFASDAVLLLAINLGWLGRQVLLGPGVRFKGWPVISAAKGSVITIGAGCCLVSRSSETALGVAHPMVLRTLARDAVIELGAGLRASGVTICAAKCVQIGARAVIGANATIADTDFHSLEPALRSSPLDAAHARCAEVVIGNDVFIGGGSFILKGVRVGDGAVIGAGAVVTRDVPAAAIVAGNPARVVGKAPK